MRAPHRSPSRTRPAAPPSRRASSVKAPTCSTTPSGSTGLGVIRVAREKGVWAIGVDSDQYDDGVSPEAPGKSAVLTSMVKRVDVAVFEAIRSVAKGELAGGVRVFGLKEEGVDYIHNGEHGQAIRPETKAKIEELRARIVRGEIRVPDGGG